VQLSGLEHPFENLIRTLESEGGFTVTEVIQDGMSGYNASNNFSSLYYELSNLFQDTIEKHESIYIEVDTLLICPIPPASAMPRLSATMIRPMSGIFL